MQIFCNNNTHETSLPSRNPKYTHFCYPLRPIRNLIPLFASVLEDYEDTIKTKETLACEYSTLEILASCKLPGVYKILESCKSPDFKTF